MVMETCLFFAIFQSNPHTLFLFIFNARKVHVGDDDGLNWSQNACLFHRLINKYFDFPIQFARIFYCPFKCSILADCSVGCSFCIAFPINLWELCLKLLQIWIDFDVQTSSLIHTQPPVVSSPIVSLN